VGQSWFYRLLENKYYLDAFYMGAIIRPIRDPISRLAYWTNQNILDSIVNAVGAGTLGLGRKTYSHVDQPIVDGAVNGLARLAGLVSARVRYWQTGNVQTYAAAMFVGLGLFVWAFIVIR